MHRAARMTAVMAGLLMTTGALAAGVGVQPAAAASVSAAASTRVNIRTGPSTGNKILGQLVRGQRITTTASPARGWVRVRFDGGSGYMYASYLNLTGKRVPAAPRTIATSGIKITTVRVNVRSGPSTSYGVVGTLSEGTDLRLTGKVSGGYAQTRYAGKPRWVSVQYLASSTKRVAAVKPPSPVASKPSSTRGATALAFAKRQLGKPYRFGAAGPSAYDCSGLTSAAWRAAGVTLPRTAAQQYRGKRISKSSLRPGDLVFFYSQTPSHVAIYAGGGKVIHSPRPGKKVEYIQMSYMRYAGAVRPG